MKKDLNSTSSFGLAPRDWKSRCGRVNTATRDPYALTFLAWSSPNDDQSTVDLVNVLSVSAFDVCNPVVQFMLMKTRNFMGDSGHSSSHGFHIRTTLTLRSVSLGAAIDTDSPQTYFSSIYCFHHRYETNARLTAATIVRIRR